MEGFGIDDPAKIADGSGSQLSLTVQAAAYAWGKKILGSVMTLASHDALTENRPGLADILNELEDMGIITADEIDQLTNDAGHTYVATANVTYTRDGAGALAIIQALYDNQYNTVKAATDDYLNNPSGYNYKNSQEFATQDEAHAYTYAGSYQGTSTATIQSYNNRSYSLVRNGLNELDAAYRAMSIADDLVHTELRGDLTTETNPLTYSQIGQISMAGSPSVQLPDFMNLDKSVDSTLLSRAFSDDNVNALTAIGQKAFINSYKTELKNATDAFKAGAALAEQNYENSINGDIPAVEEAGSYKGLNYQSDGSGVLSGRSGMPLSDGTDTEAHPGRAFTDGYNVNLVTVNVTTSAANTDDAAAFEQTSMFDAQEALHTLRGKSITVTAPTPDAGWSVASDNPVVIESADDTSAIAFIYNRTAAYNYASLNDQTGTYDGQLASTLLNDSDFTPAWNDDDSGQQIALDKGWLAVDNDDIKVGTYTYHLTQAGAEALIAQLQADEGSDFFDTHELPTITNLMAMKGNLTVVQTTDESLLPKINGHDVTYVIGTAKPTAPDYVYNATGANGDQVSSTLVTADDTAVDWDTDGTYGVTLSLTDPISNQTVSQLVNLIVMSAEASTSTSEAQNLASTSAEASVSQQTSKSTASVNNAEDSASASEASLSQRSTSDQSDNSEASVSDASLSDRSVSDMSLNSESITSTQSASESRAQQSQSKASQQSASEASQSEASVSDASRSQASVSESMASVVSVSESQFESQQSAWSTSNARDSASMSVSEASLSDASTSEASQQSNASTSVASLSNDSVSVDSMISASDTSLLSETSVSLSQELSAVVSAEQSSSLTSMSQTSQSTDRSASQVSMSEASMSQLSEQSELSASRASQAQDSEQSIISTSLASLSERSLSGESLASQTSAAES